MNIPFETAVEARKIVDDFHRQLKSLKHGDDLKKMANNLDQLVSDLSKAEVLARTNRNPRYSDKPKQDLAAAIDYMDKMMLMLRLFQ
jgi:polyhydroxyalkanoate synthesis regulator phasin